MIRDTATYRRRGGGCSAAISCSSAVSGWISIQRSGPRAASVSQGDAGSGRGSAGVSDLMTMDGVAASQAAV